MKKYSLLHYSKPIISIDSREGEGEFIAVVERNYDIFRSQYYHIRKIILIAFAELPVKFACVFWLRNVASYNIIFVLIRRIICIIYGYCYRNDVFGQLLHVSVDVSHVYVYNTYEEAVRNDSFTAYLSEEYHKCINSIFDIISQEDECKAVLEAYRNSSSTYKLVSDMLGISTERARQIYNRVIHYLRCNTLIANNLKLFNDN